MEKDGLGTSRFQIQRPKPLGHAASLRNKPVGMNSAEIMLVSSLLTSSVLLDKQSVTRSFN